MRRVIVLADYGGPYAGSFIPMMRAAVAAARSRGWATELVFSEDGSDKDWLRDLRDDGLAVRVAPDGTDLEHYRWLRGLLAESPGPTILHTHFSRFDVPAVMAARCRPGTAVIWHFHSPQPRDLRSRVRQVVKCGVIGIGTFRILCVEPGIAAAVRRRLAPRGAVVVVPNAIELERFPQPALPERRAARARLGLPADVPVLLHFGWQWHRKGGDLFLSAVARLAEEGLGVLAVCVGGGAPARATSARLGLDKVVRVLDPVDDVQTLYAAADAFVSSSRAEGMPFAVGEALASGLPVVATDIPGQAAIGARVPGCRVTAPDANEIADAVRSVLKRPPELAVAEAAAGRAWVADHLRLRAWADRVADIYEQALRALPTRA